MKKCLRLAAAALALVCMAGMLAGCGNDPGAATKPEADKIVLQINKVIEEPPETKGLSYKYVAGYVEDGFIFNKYSTTDTTNQNNGNDIVTLEIIFTEDTKNFVGSRVSSSVREGGHIYTYTRVTYPYIKEFQMDNLTNDMVELYDKYQKEGATLNDFKVSCLENENARNFMLIKSDYYHQLKY